MAAVNSLAGNPAQEHQAAMSALKAAMSMHKSRMTGATSATPDGDQQMLGLMNRAHAGMQNVAKAMGY